MIDLIVEQLSWLALPVLLICVIDDWFLRTGRELRVEEGARIHDPVIMKFLYGVLPILVLASLYRLLSAQRADLSFVLVLITAISGVVWALEHFVFRHIRTGAALAAGRDPEKLQLPNTVDYARSFFPIMAVLLVVRSFIFEPYRIPSDSMMPTLLDGDFIVVNKFAYGLRWPVMHQKFLSVGLPMRGDVVVFRWPPDTGINYVKRVVGLPGDLVEIRSDQIFINGRSISFKFLGRYQDGCYLNMRLAEENMEGRPHKVLHCLSGDSLAIPLLPSCDRDISQSYLCNEATENRVDDSGDATMQVPLGQYLMVGDNRDNSSDGRYWGFVDESLLVGKANLIWFNWDLQRSGGPNWSRIGTQIK